MGKVEVKALPAGVRGFRKATIKAVITRADGTVEDKGVIATGYGSWRYAVADTYRDTLNKIRARLAELPCGCFKR